MYAHAGEGSAIRVDAVSRQRRYGRDSPRGQGWTCSTKARWGLLTAGSRRGCTRGDDALAWQLLGAAKPRPESPCQGALA
eukprot:15473556-Alexandrium_andersonii.AAC.1